MIVNDDECDDKGNDNNNSDSRHHGLSWAGNVSVSVNESDSPSLPACFA